MTDIHVSHDVLTRLREVTEERDNLKLQLDNLRSVHKKLSEEVHGALSFMPDCWPDGYTIYDFVASIIGGEVHAPACDCFRPENT